MYRSRKTAKKYNPNEVRKSLGSDEATCPFCHVENRTIFNDGVTMRVTQNRFPYEYWDNLNVTEHLLLTPKRHLESLEEFNNDEKIEAMNLMAEYEAKGYSVYGRSKINTRRTVPHQHTHLIKVAGDSPRLTIYSKKPYFVWKI